MRHARRTHGRTQPGEWGVVEVWSRHGLGQGAPVWLAFWMDLAPGGMVSIEIDADRDPNITPATWGRARRALGLPGRILVLDDPTAARVRTAVPASVPVIVTPDHPRLTAMATAFDDLPHDDDDLDLDLLPFPAPRARC